MERNIDNFRVVICPTYESAEKFKEEYEVDATIEAEYGDNVLEGEFYTGAHHGERSNNPAPCNDPNVPVLEGGTIVVSHIDLDTVGGIMAVTGDKPDDPKFWAAAEYIDVNGAHHIHDIEIGEEERDKLNAMYAWNAQQERVRFDEPTDITSLVKANYDVIERISRGDPELIQAGKDWEKEVVRQVEEKNVYDGPYVRGFVTDGVFCASSYYSPETQSIKEATVTYNEKFKSITIALADGGKNLSAKDLAQELWGEGAGGRDGIAGSPRGQEMTMADFEKAKEIVEERVQEIELRKIDMDFKETMEKVNAAKERHDAEIAQTKEVLPERDGDESQEPTKNTSRDDFDDR